jgi:hypothetical protein
MKLGKDTGSIVNYLYGNNATVPIIGKGATVLLWTDRHAYEVLEINEKEKTVVIQAYEAVRMDKNNESENQEYSYDKLVGEKMILKFKNGFWKYCTHHIIYTDEALEDTNISHHILDIYKKMGGEMDDYFNKITVIPNLTKIKNEWHKINIIFGVKNEYYDYSF